MSPQEFDTRLRFLLQSTEALHATVTEQSGQIAENARQITENGRQIAENSRMIGALARIAEAHQNRLDDLGNGQ